MLNRQLAKKRPLVLSIPEKIPHFVRGMTLFAEERSLEAVVKQSF